MNDTDLALATYVAIPNPNNWTDGCTAWVESRDAQCGKPRTEGFLCKRHHTTAVKRMEKNRAETVAKQEKRMSERAESIRVNGKEWMDRLDRVNSELNRRTGSLVKDRAATGGNVHPSIKKKVLGQFSDSNVSRVAELLRIKGDLERKLGL